MTTSSIGRFLQPQWASARLAGGVLACALFVAFALPSDVGLALAAENGPIETLQALLFFALAAGIWLVRRPGDSLRTTGSLTLLLLAMGGRELEWQKAWTGDSVLKPRFYLGDATPGSKLLVVGILLVLACAAIDLARRHFRPLWIAWRARRPLAITSATFLAVLAASRLVDKILLGTAVDPSILAAKVLIEETLELALPLLVLLGAFQYSAARFELPEVAAEVDTRPTPIAS